MAYLVLPPELVPQLSTVINWTMTFTPLISYGSTALSIRRHRSSQGFAIDICATMLLSSTLRIFYYFCAPFEVSLLRQCFTMVFIQLILLHISLKYRPEGMYNSLEEYDGRWADVPEKLTACTIDLVEDFDALCREDGSGSGPILRGRLLAHGLLEVAKHGAYRYAVVLGAFLFKVGSEVIRFFDAHYIRPFKFWQWRNPATYWKFLGCFLTVLSACQWFLRGHERYGMLLGTTSFLIESSLPLPQILLFERVRTAQNFKPILLVSWVGGDLTKISYLIYGTDNVGALFVVAALFQMSLNLVITYQFFKYRKMDRELDTPLPIEMYDLEDHQPSGVSSIPSRAVGTSSRASSITLLEDEFPRSPRSRASTLTQHEDLERTTSRKMVAIGE